MMKNAYVVNKDFFQEDPGALETNRWALLRLFLIALFEEVIGM